MQTAATLSALFWAPCLAAVQTCLQLIQLLPPVLTPLLLRFFLPASQRQGQDNPAPLKSCLQRVGLPLEQWGDVEVGDLVFCFVH